MAFLQRCSSVMDLLVAGGSRVADVVAFYF